MGDFYERFYVGRMPTATNETKKTMQDKKEVEFPVYLDPDGQPMMWSGAFPIPALSSRVYITMNRIGWAVVKGCFSSCGFIGLMTLPENPPKWLVDQNKRAYADGKPRPGWMVSGIGCEFGSELSLTEPPKRAAAK